MLHHRDRFRAGRRARPRRRRRRPDVGRHLGRPGRPGPSWSPTCGASATPEPPAGRRRLEQLGRRPGPAGPPRHRRGRTRRRVLRRPGGHRGRGHRAGPGDPAWSCWRRPRPGWSGRGAAGVQRRGGRAARGRRRRGRDWSLNVRTWLAGRRRRGPGAGARHAEAGFEVQLAADPDAEPAPVHADPSRITAPTTVVVGAHDFPDYAEAARRLRDTIPAAEPGGPGWAGYPTSSSGPQRRSRSSGAHWAGGQPLSPERDTPSMM